MGRSCYLGARWPVSAADDVNAIRLASRRTRAFAFIEILVVIAIILILAGLLTPVFASARGRAGRTTCTNNLHQVGQAILLYRSDHDNGRPPDLVTLYPKYLTILEPLACPNDRWLAEGGYDWLNFGQFLSGSIDHRPWPGPSSYRYPWTLKPADHNQLWQAAEASGRRLAMAACVIHGKPVGGSHVLPEPYTGTVLRLGFDGSVFTVKLNKHTSGHVWYTLADAEPPANLGDPIIIPQD